MTFNNLVQYVSTFNLEILMIFLLLFVCLSLIIIVQYRRNLANTRALLQASIAREASTKTNQELTKLLNNIFESSLDGIIAFSSVRDDKQQIIDFKYQMINKVATSIIGKDASELINHNLLDLLPGNRESGLFDAYKHTTETGEAFNTVIDYQHDDIDRWFLIRAVKNLDGFIVTFSDVSEFKHNESLLIKKQSDLETINDELNQFVYIASHDLMEPLRKVRAFGDRLTASINHDSNEKTLDYVSRMTSAASRMQTLIDDLLMFSRASRTNMSVQTVDLNTVLAEVNDILSELIVETDAHITSDTLPTLTARRSQMVQLFQNIIANSLKYCPSDRPPSITISVKEVSLQADETTSKYWQIRISDNGIGFDNEHSETIFEIFKRLHGRSKYSGSGIGLAICKKILLNHKGSIYAQSEQGKGAVFTIELPQEKI